MGEKSDPLAQWAQDASRQRRDSLRVYLIGIQARLRMQPKSLARDAELVSLEGWIAWLQGAA